MFSRIRRFLRRFLLVGLESQIADAVTKQGYGLHFAERKRK